MKMTNQKIEQYALLYHGIECVKLINEEEETETDLLQPSDIWNWIIEDGYQIQYIQLRSIDSITDEELLKIAALITEENYPIGCEGNHIMASKTVVYWLYKNIGNFENFISALEWEYIFSYLRSIGIATPYLGFTVEEMVNEGILKLI